MAVPCCEPWATWPFSLHAGILRWRTGTRSLESHFRPSTPPPFRFIPRVAPHGQHLRYCTRPLNMTRRVAKYPTCFHPEPEPPPPLTVTTEHNPTNCTIKSHSTISTTSVSVHALQRSTVPHLYNTALAHFAIILAAILALLCKQLPFAAESGRAAVASVLWRPHPRLQHVGHHHG